MDGKGLSVDMDGSSVSGWMDPYPASQIPTHVSTPFKSCLEYKPVLGVGWVFALLIAQVRKSKTKEPEMRRKMTENYL